MARPVRASTAVGLPLAVMLAASCGSKEDAALAALGDWGGLGLELHASATSTEVIPCGGAWVIGVLQPDDSGRFVTETGVGTADDEPRRIRVEGRVTGRQMEVTVSVCDGGRPCFAVRAPTEGDDFVPTFLLEKGVPGRFRRANGTGVCVPPVCLGCPP